MRDNILNLPDNKTGQLLGKLFITIGMPVMITKNIAVSLHIMNGASGTIEKIIPTEGELKEINTGEIATLKN